MLCNEQLLFAVERSSPKRERTVKVRKASERQSAGINPELRIGLTDICLHAEKMKSQFEVNWSNNSSNENQNIN